MAHPGGTATSDPADLPPASRAAQRRLRHLQDDIMDLILERDLDVGDPMPTESELCRALGVGRNTVREALKVLQAFGVVEIRHGFGTFVASTSFDALTASLTFRGRLSLRHGGREALELVDVRQALEAGLVGLAIDVITEAELAELEACVRAMEDSAAQGRAFLEADQEFHRVLYGSLHNDLLTSLLEVFWTAYGRIYREASPSPADLVETAHDHRLILDAVRANDRQRAAERLTVHFRGIREHLAHLGG